MKFVDEQFSYIFLQALQPNGMTHHIMQEELYDFSVYNQIFYFLRSHIFISIQQRKLQTF